MSPKSRKHPNQGLAKITLNAVAASQLNQSTLTGASLIWIEKLRSG